MEGLLGANGNGWYFGGNCTPLADYADNQGAVDASYYFTNTSKYSVTPFWSQHNHVIAHTFWSEANVVGRPAFDSTHVSWINVLPDMQNSQSNSWTDNWKPLSPATSFNMGSDLTTVTWGRVTPNTQAQAYDQFVWDTNGNLEHRYSRDTGSTWNWNSWGAPSSCTSRTAPDSASSKPGALVVVAICDTQEQVAVYRYDDTDTGHNGWSLPLSAPSGQTFRGGVAPTVTSSQPGQYDLFALDSQTSPHLWHVVSTDNGVTWGAWHDWGAASTYPCTEGNPDAASWGNGRIDAVCAGYDSLSTGYISHWYCDSCGETPSRDYISPPGGGVAIFGEPPSIVALGEYRLNVYVRSVDNSYGDVWHWFYDPNGNGAGWAHDCPAGNSSCSSYGVEMTQYAKIDASR